jgi:chaperonin GroES
VLTKCFVTSPEKLANANFCVALRVFCNPLALIFKGNAMKLRPLADRVIVKRVDSETKTASGIVIPDAAAEKPDQGEVLAVGPGRTNDKGEIKALSVKVGDKVLFGKYSGQTVKVGGDELLVMKEDDLFAVVES